MNVVLRASVALICCLPALAGAQDLTITNARILDGTGKVIDNGTIVVTGGRIVSVSANAAPARRARGPEVGGGTIDAGGKTVMPGFIDAHRHLVAGDNPQWLTKDAP